MSFQGRKFATCESGKLSGISPAARGLVRENEGPSTIESVQDFTVRTSTTKDNGLYVQAVIGGQAVKMLVDSGASVTVLNSHFMNKVEGDILMTDAGLEMTAADGQCLSPDMENSKSALEM